MAKAARIAHLAIVLLMLTAGRGVGDDVPHVVASIKPIHSLVAGVMEGVATPVLLVRGAGSPHGYSLRPSDAQALQQATAVFWIGPELETFLAKPLDALARGARVVEVAEFKGVSLLPARSGGAWNNQADHHETAESGKSHAGDDHDQHHHSGSVDLHLWLDPSNAKAIASGVAKVLSELDPSRAATYEENADRLRRKLEALDRELAAKLKPVQDRQYVVFHDAYHYLEDRYGLTPIGAITIGPERAPGVQRLQAIRFSIAQSGATCVFREPQFAPDVLRTVTEGVAVRTGVLDPLGADLEAGPAAYFDLMRGLERSLVECLAPSD